MRHRINRFTKAKYRSRKPNKTRYSIIWTVFRYPKAYTLAQELRNIFKKKKTADKIIGFAKLTKWHEKIDQSEFKSYNISNYNQTILNYFDNKNTYASAEFFNAKIKAFRSQFRSVRNIVFFLLD
jgi:transposase